MAEGKTLKSAQRGIAFSTFMALIVSILILIVGDGTHQKSKGVFTIANLAEIIEKLTGKAGLWVFGIGFIAAALSSMLTVPLGAALTAESVFSIPPSTEQPNELRYTKQEDSSSSLSLPSSANEEKVEITRSHSSYPGRPFPKKYSRVLISVMVAVAVIVISADAPTVKVILIAQVCFILSLRFSSSMFHFFVFFFQ